MTVLGSRPGWCTGGSETVDGLHADADIVGWGHVRHRSGRLVQPVGAQGDRWDVFEPERIEITTKHFMESQGKSRRIRSHVERTSLIVCQHLRQDRDDEEEKKEGDDEDGDDDDVIRDDILESRTAKMIESTVDAERCASILPGSRALRLGTIYSNSRISQSSSTRSETVHATPCPPKESFRYAAEPRTVGAIRPSGPGLDAGVPTS